MPHFVISIVRGMRRNYVVRTQEGGVLCDDEPWMASIVIKAYC